MKTFEGKTAVVTGAASGIGLGLAEKFALERMNVVLADVEEEALNQAVTQLADRQHSVVGVVTDVRYQASLQNLLEEATAAFGNVHILCNNAGVAATRAAVTPVWEVAPADWDWTMSVNFQGVLYGIQLFVPHMLAHGEASHIVNTASLAAVTAGGGPYSVSKHGVLALTEGLQRDFLNTGANIRTSVLCPGYVRTNILQSERNRPGELATEQGADKGADQGPEAQLAQHLIRQGKDPREVADIVFQAIFDQDLYVLPHAGWDDVIRQRFEHILARKGLPVVDFKALMRRREAGEDI